MTIFKLTDLGEGLQEAEIVAWHVGVGDRVVADQPLVSVETEKAVVEIPAPQSGRVAELFAGVGDTVRIGTPLVSFADQAAVDSGTVVGTIPAETPAKPAAKKEGGARGVKASPAVRNLARRLGVDLAAIDASGPDGAVTARDVEGAAAVVASRGRAEPLRGVRRAMARNMTRAHAAVVPTTVTDEADVGAWTPKDDVTIRLIRAIVAACRAEPALNAWYFSDREERQLHDRIDLGIAMDTEDGLFVPVLRDVAKRDAADLRGRLEAIKQGVEQRSVPLAELRGQTITLSNFGMHGGRHAALVVLPPQVAILGAGRREKRVVAIGDKPVVHPVLPLSLTFDHRAVTGGEASRFLSAAIEDLRQPT
jgi:2-oxoisovalerate dehydrogenase E2 component (dihydrolipoyl transacylase)